MEQTIDQALDEVRTLHEKILGVPASLPEPAQCLPFPPGVDPVRYAIDEVEHLRRFVETTGVPQPRTTWIPRADMFATPEGLLVRMEIPGVRREDLEVVLVGRELIVRGTRKPCWDDKHRPLATEIPWGRFERRVVLPEGGGEAIDAECRDGILEIRIRSASASGSREKRIEIH
ncbi:MAG: hypothetical protein Kow0062_18410 [Acidobacteriota bacterium]|nr:MAG: Hsp20/alpha crystallin family protein [Acidobacteriota bacterium]